MTVLTSRAMFERELQKLYRAELEILDFNADLADAAVSDNVAAIFRDHEDETVEQIHRIERIFEKLDAKPRPEGSPVMEGILAEKDALVSTEATNELRDPDVLSTGMMNERFEITVLDRLLLLAAELALEDEIVRGLEANRREARAALTEMEAILERRRTE